MVGGGGSDWDLALVSEAPAGVTDAFEKLLIASEGEDDANRYRLVRVDGPIATVREGLADRLGSEELDGYVAVPVAWIAGKVYRVGILSTGKRPSFGELVRWVRSA